MRPQRQMPMNLMPGGMPDVVEIRPDEYVFAAEVEGYVEAMPGVWMYANNGTIEGAIQQ